MAGASPHDREIHTLVLAGNDVAFARLCDEYYEPVFKKVSSFNRGIFNADDTLVADVVTDAFLNYFKQPSRYNPGKQSLEYFLVMDAEGDLKNAWQKLKRHQKKFTDPVELFEAGGNSVLGDDLLTPFDYVLHKEAAELLEQKLTALFSNESDVLLAQLMLAGERRTVEYARLLGLEHLTEAEQRHEVKKQKDRIDKVMRRKLRGSDNG